MNPIQSLYQIQLPRPDEAIREIVQAVHEEYMNISSHNVELFTSIVDECFIGDGYIYVINSRGSVSFWSERKSLVSVSRTPLIIGSIGLFGYNIKLYSVKFEAGIHVYRMSIDHFRALIDKFQLWKQISNITSYYLSGLIISMERTLSRNSTEIVRMLIPEYMALTQVVKMETQLCEFIMSRSLLSRSGVMEILSKMKRQGYICIKRGKLLSFNF